MGFASATGQEQQFVVFNMFMFLLTLEWRDWQQGVVHKKSESQEKMPEELSSHLDLSYQASQASSSLLLSLPILLARVGHKSPEGQH